MSLKILCFGENEFMNATIASVRSDFRLPSDDQIIVDTFHVSGKAFLTFSIMNSQLIASQAAGTNALLYFLSGENSIYQQKDFLFGVFNQRPQFQGLPVVIAYDKEQNLSIKDIVNHFELFKVKDRASMIKQVDRMDVETSKQIFNWINNQVEFQRNKTFDAQPKVVKMKPKYRDSQPESTLKKYEEIMKEKKLKNNTVKEQQQTYIVKEKQRIKNQNMEKQLANFNKNKKKMSPYDIKATPNPRIEANLHFFLKDPHVDKGSEVNIKIQTDQFKEKPKEKPYVPKKTGTNIATQIQPTQLFDFDKEVQPILDNLTSRALELATLEIQEEEETLKIAKYKDGYNERVKKQKKHESQKIQAEINTIKQKDRLLEMARKKDEVKRNITKKVSTYSFANKFLEGIYESAAVRLYNQNYYPNNLENQLKTDYLNEVLERSLVSYEKLIQKESCLNSIFEDPCIKPITTKAEGPKKEHNKIKQIRDERRINKGNSTRYVHVFYDHGAQKRFSSFSKYIEKEMAGSLEQYVTKREEEIQEVEEKHQTSEVDEHEVARVKQKDNVEFGSTHKSFLINSDKNICFTTTSNKYQKPQSNILEGGIASFDKESNLVHMVFNHEESKCKYLETVHNLRYFKDITNMDDGIVIKFASVPDQIKSFVMFSKVNNVAELAGEGQAKNIKNAVYGLQFYDKGISLVREDIGEGIKWEEFGKPSGDGDEVKETVDESVYIVGYLLTRKNVQYWNLEEIKYVSKATPSSNSEFVDKMVNFFKKSQQILKQEEQEEKKKTPSRNKRRSKKNLEEKEVQAKPQVKIGSRVLKQVKLDLLSQFETNQLKLRDEVVEWKQFIESCPDGWQLLVKGKKLSGNEELKKFKKVGDITVKRIPPPVVEEKEQQPEKQENANEDDN